MAAKSALEQHEIKSKTRNAVYACAAKYSFAREPAQIGGESLPIVRYAGQAPQGQIAPDLRNRRAPFLPAERSSDPRASMAAVFGRTSPFGGNSGAEESTDRTWFRIGVAGLRELY